MRGEGGRAGRLKKNKKEEGWKEEEPGEGEGVEEEQKF